MVSPDLCQLIADGCANRDLLDSGDVRLSLDTGDTFLLAERAIVRLHDRVSADGLAAVVPTVGSLRPSPKHGADLDLKARTGVQKSEPLSMFDHEKGFQSYTNEPHDVRKRPLRCGRRPWQLIPVYGRYHFLCDQRALECRAQA